MKKNTTPANRLWVSNNTSPLNSIGITNSYVSTNNEISERNQDDSIFKDMISYMTEDELRVFLENIRKTNIIESLYNDILIFIIRNRHLSEDFIMDLYVGRFSVRKLEMELSKLHSADIHSHVYSRIVLLIETDDDSE